MSFKTELFVRSVDENLICSICHEVFQDPVSCKDGHTFCKDCITRWLKTNKKCPLDNGALEEKHLVRVLMASGIIGNLDVHCHPQVAVNVDKSLSASKVGGFEGKCDWIGKLHSLTRHRKTCPFLEVQCPHGCNEKVQRSKMEDHEKICDQKLVDCGECGLNMLRKDLQKHKKNECLQALVSCPNKCTDNTIKRIDLDDHLSKVCPKVLVDCPYKEQGCVVKVERQDVEKHVQENMAGHMMLLAKECSLLKKQNQSLTDKCSSLRIELKDVKKKIQLIEDDHQSSSYTWTITNFRAQKKTRPSLSYFRSPTFWLCGYSWYLKIVTEGDYKVDAKSIGSLSLFLNASCDPNCGGHKFVVVPNGIISVHFRLTLKSLNPQYPDVSREASYLFRHNKTESFGWPVFVNLEKVCSPAHYDSKNDSITIQCKILPTKLQ